MSAHLLQNPGELHTLRDDLESFLHVLAWTTLRYVPAIDSYTADNRVEDLVAFNEHSVYQGGIDHGGRRKSESLASGLYPSQTFQPRQLTPLCDLLEVLSQSFKSRYARKPPTAGERLKRSSLANISDKKLSWLSRAINEYHEALQQLQSSSFFVDEMQMALDENDWPTDDEADGNLPIASLAGDTGKELEARAESNAGAEYETSSRYPCCIRNDGLIIS